MPVQPPATPPAELSLDRRREDDLAVPVWDIDVSVPVVPAEKSATVVSARPAEGVVKFTGAAGVRRGRRVVGASVEMTR